MSKAKTIKELKEVFIKKHRRYEECVHEFNDKPSYCMAVERFGGECIGIYECKKCGFRTIKEGINL